MTSSPPSRDLVGAVLTSSFCTDGGCVGIAEVSGHVVVVDTKDADLPHLRFTREEWAAFVAGVKNGEFDLA